MNRSRVCSINRRNGFTLLELMIVIGLIALLLSISVGTLRNAIGLARQRQTETTILKIHGLLQQRVEAFDRAMDKLNLTQPKQKLTLDFNGKYGSSYFLNYAQDSRLIETLVRKQLQQARFPQNFAERDLSGSASLPPLAPHNPVTQSSALLYWILTGSEIFGVPPVDESDFSSAEVQDTDGDGLKEFVDGWGRPLRFYRWPTQLFRTGSGASPQPGAIGYQSLSPVDPSRTYASVIWSGLPSANATGYDPLSQDPDDPTAQMYLAARADSSGTVMRAFEDLFNTPSTYHAFLIVSAGPDGVLGLGEPFDYFGTNDPTQSPPPTTTWPSLTIPLVSSPALGTSQGRLAALDPKYIDSNGYYSVERHPINDNITNRKR